MGVLELGGVRYSRLLCRRRLFDQSTQPAVAHSTSARLWWCPWWNMLVERARLRSSQWVARSFASATHAFCLGPPLRGVRRSLLVSRRAIDCRAALGRWVGLVKQSGVEEPLGDGGVHGILSCLDSEFAVDGDEGVGDGREAVAEVAADLNVGPSLCDEPQDRQVAFAEPRLPVAMARLAWAVAGRRGIRMADEPCSGGRDPAPEGPIGCEVGLLVGGDDERTHGVPPPVDRKRQAVAAQACGVVVAVIGFAD